ncbi:MAG TPA: ATP-binding protein, partial [Terriglobales bacterium]
MLTLLVTADARRTFNHLQEQRTGILLAQLQKELAQRGKEVSSRVQSIARSDAASEIAAQSRASSDYAQFLNQAGTINASQPLDFLSFVDAQGAIISSAHAPASFGYRDPLFIEERDWTNQQPFLADRDLPAGTELALLDVALVPFPGTKLYVIGGIKLDDSYLRSLPLPPGMTLLLRRYLPNDSVSEASSSDSDRSELDKQLAPVFQELGHDPQTRSMRVAANGSLPEQDVTAIPLKGIRGDLLGVLLVANSRQELVDLRRNILRNAMLAGVSVFLVSMLAAFVFARQITRPIEELSQAADEITAGAWGAKVEIASQDEIGKLASHFNTMTAELISQRDRLVQSERVAAWRELARRLAHELKNPLFPLQITVENLLRARAQYPDQFDEVFQESTRTLLAEIANLKTIIGRFSDFSRMPVPEMQTVDLNLLLQETVKLFQAQLPQTGAGISVKLDLDSSLRPIEADPVLLRRVFENLMLNAVDAMPQGGVLSLKTRQLSSAALVEISDTGAGVMPEEAERLFTPYYTTKKHGTGLGLAIAQSVIS